MRYTNPVLSTFRAKDGDTFGLTIGHSSTLTEKLVARINGYDCPETRRTKCSTCELYASLYEIGQAAKATELTIEFITSLGQLTSIREDKRDNFGRDLIQLHHEFDGIITDLGTALHDAELATVWPTRWHEVYDPKRDGT